MLAQWVGTMWSDARTEFFTLRSLRAVNYLQLIRYAYQIEVKIFPFCRRRQYVPGDRRGPGITFATASVAPRRVRLFPMKSNSGEQTSLPEYRIA